MKKTLVLAVAVAFCSTAPFVSAATVVWGPTAFDNGGGGYLAGASGGFNVPQFDPSLGTLDSVFVEVTGNSAGGSNAVDNESEFPGTVNSIEIGSNITVSGPAALVVLTTPSQSASGSVDADNEPANGGPDFLGTDSFMITGTTSSDSQDDFLATAVPFNDDLSAYIGLGDVSFGYASSVNSSNSVTFAPVNALALPPNFDFTTTVTYTYTVPEPAGLSLLAVGGLLALRRRR